MKLTKKQITVIKKALKKANKAENVLAGAIGDLAYIISETINVDGNVDFLAGDGFGFAPQNKNIHIPVDHLIEFAEKGVEITEEFILRNLSI